LNFKKELEIIRQVKETLTAQSTIKKYRVNEPDWTRERKLTFDRVAALILSGHKLAQQTAVRLSRAFGAKGAVASALLWLGASSVLIIASDSSCRRLGSANRDAVFIKNE